MFSRNTEIVLILLLVVCLFTACSKKNTSIYDQCLTLESIVKDTTNCEELAERLSEGLSDLKPIYTQWQKDTSNDAPSQLAMRPIAPCTRALLQATLGICKDNRAVQDALTSFDHTLLH